MMTKTEAVEYMTDIMAKFVGYSGKVLPDDVTEKLKELRALETGELPKTIYDTMFRNQELAVLLDRPCCQDTGVLQYLVKCGTRFPLIDFVETLLKEATVRATFDAPLRHNSVETFDEYNTGKNVLGDCSGMRYLRDLFLYGRRRLFPARQGHGPYAGSGI